MAFAYLVSTIASDFSAGTVTTSPGINTSGANLIVIAAGMRSGETPTISDNKSNSYTGTTRYNAGDFGAIEFFYLYGGTVGSGHTFTIAGTANLCTIAVIAFSGSASSPFDAINGSGSPTTSGSTQIIQTGSITPAANDEVIVSAVENYLQTDHAATIDSGMTIVQDDFGITLISSALAYKIQTTAAAINPTWTMPDNAGGSVRVQSASVICFTSGGGGATGWGPLLGSQRSRLVQL